MNLDGFGGGHEARDKGIARVTRVRDEAAERYKDAYRDEFARLAALGVEFCSDDIVRAIGAPPASLHPNAIGGIFFGCVRQRRVFVVGVRHMERTKAHARITRTYRGLP